MAHQYQHKKWNGQNQALSLFKKIVKVILIAFICFVVLIATTAGFIIYQENHPKTPITTTQRPVSDSTETTDSAENEYIDTPIYNERILYASKSTAIPISCTDNAYASIVDAIKNDDSDFRMAEYYALADTLRLYDNTVVDKSSETTLLTNGKLDADKLYRRVLSNNAAVTTNGKNTLNVFYSDLDETEIAAICDEIAKVVNDASGEIDINKVANTLDRLTIFEHKGGTVNAAISTKLAFTYNPGMVELYRQKHIALGGSPEVVWEMVVDHEVMHIIQHGANDGNDANGIEAGFCRMYNEQNDEKNIPVDSLYFSWILEAGAELGMADYLNVEPGTYQKKISYARSYNLSRFYQIDSNRDMLENIAFKHTLEDALTALGIDSESEKQEFLKFMYSIEITQTEPDELWEYYESTTGRTLTDEEKTGIRMDIRTDAVKYLTKSFFMNITNAVHDGAITDLDSLFYLLRLWELDAFNHLEYTKVSSLAHAEDFVLWYDQTQNVILTAIAESSGIDLTQIQTLYSEYSLRMKTESNGVTDNCDFAGLSRYMQDYVMSLKENYASSKFSRIHDVAKWLKS